MSLVMTLIPLTIMGAIALFVVLWDIYRPLIKKNTSGQNTDQKYIKAWRRKRVVILSFVIVVFVAGPIVLIESSESFINCEKDRKYSEPYKALHEKSGLFVKTIAGFQLDVACGRVTSSQNDGAVIALSTIVVAVFTFALWQSTEKLWRATITMEQHTERALLYTERAFVHLKGYSQMSPNVDETGVVRQWVFFGILENTGTTPTKFMLHHINKWTWDGDIPAGFDFPDFWGG